MVLFYGSPELKADKDAALAAVQLNSISHFSKIAPLLNIVAKSIL